MILHKRILQYFGCREDKTLTNDSKLIYIISQIDEVHNFLIFGKREE